MSTYQAEDFRKLVDKLNEYLMFSEKEEEDPTNADVRYTRNRIRAQLMPAWARAFPGYRAALARSAAHAAQAQRLLDELAALDLAATGEPPRIVDAEEGTGPPRGVRVPHEEDAEAVLPVDDLVVHDPQLVLEGPVPRRQLPERGDGRVGRAVGVMDGRAVPGRSVLVPGRQVVRDRERLAVADEHADRLATIRDVHQRHGEMIDTHTADGVKVAREHLQADTPMIVLETALPIKFAATLVEALGVEPGRPAKFDGIEQLPRRVQVMKADVNEIKRYIAEHCPDAP